MIPVNGKSCHFPTPTLIVYFNFLLIKASEEKELGNTLSAVTDRRWVTLTQTYKTFQKNFHLH